MSPIRITGSGPTTLRTMTWPDFDATVLTDAWRDVRYFGAKGDGLANDTAAIQAAITATVAAGGGTVYLPRGVYKISDPLILNMGNATTSVAILGAGQATSQILHTDNAKDLFQIGATGADVAEWIQIRDLRLTNGRYGLNLNNALGGRFERLTIESNSTCLYFQGQNEFHAFRDIGLIGNGATVHGIWGANLNGGPGTLLDLPEIQKCAFERIRIFGMADVGILLTAGVLGAQQSSGSNRFRDLLFESNKRGNIEIHYSFSTSIDGMSNEDALDAHNVYAAISVTDASNVVVRNAYLIGNGANKPKYMAYVHGATLAICDSSLSSAATAGVRNDGGGTALTLINVSVDTRADLSFADATCRGLSQLIGVRDGSANPIETDITQIATANLPSNGANANDLQIAIENAGAGVKNLIVFAGGQRFRISGGTAF